MNQPVFISYRRETGHQLANLVASELQGRGYTTFLDVRRPEAGRFWDQIKANSFSVCFCSTLWSKNSNELK